MTSNVFDVRSGFKLFGNGLFFDTCVWLSIYGPDSREHKRCFSDFFDAALSSNTPIFINDFVISEFHNRSIKIDYRTFFRDDENLRKFKERRKNGELSDILGNAKDTCLNIIDDCRPALAFTAFDQVSDCLSVCAGGELDFTDSVIQGQCRRENLTLVTSDGDYAGTDVPLVTDNLRLLRGGSF